MRRRRLAWAVTLPLVAAGGLSAHVLAYALVSSHHHSGSRAHAALVHWHVCVALFVALAAIGALAFVLDGVRGHPGGRLPVWAFALLPPSAFIVQEHLEHVFQHGHVSYALAVEPVFLLGLLLQIPFAVAAYAVARALVSVASTLIRALGHGRPRLAPTLPSFHVGPEPAPALAHPVALGHGQRAPPRLLLSL